MKISIIVPVYNIQDYIGRCLECLINQTYSNIEILVINDGSTDKSLDICYKYSSLDKRIRVIDKPNGGLSDARNEGIKYATGDYILFVDGDDSIETSTCSDLSRIALIEKTDLIFFNYTKIINGKKLLSSLDTQKVESLTQKEAYRRYLYGENIVPAAWSRLYSREILKKVNFPYGMLAEDYATTHKFILEAKNIFYYDKALYNYFIREDSIMGTKSLKLTLDYYKTAEQKYQSELKLFPEYRKQVESLYTNCLLRTFTRLYVEDREHIIFDEVVLKLKSINFKNLNLKTKLAYCVYRTNLNLFVFFMTKFNKVI